MSEAILSSLMFLFARINITRSVLFGVFKETNTSFLGLPLYDLQSKKSGNTLEVIANNSLNNVSNKFYGIDLIGF